MPIKINGIPGTVGTIAPARPNTISANATTCSRMPMIEVYPSEEFRMSRSRIGGESGHPPHRCGEPLYSLLDLVRIQLTVTKHEARQPPGLMGPVLWEEEGTPWVHEHSFVLRCFQKVG